MKSWKCECQSIRLDVGTLEDVGQAVGGVGGWGHPPPTLILNTTMAVPHFHWLELVMEVEVAEKGVLGLVMEVVVAEKGVLKLKLEVAE